MLSKELRGFDVREYIRLLTAIAAVDGIDPVEEDFIRKQAAEFGVDADALLKDPPNDLNVIVGDSSHVTRRAIYRDCFMLAQADNTFSFAERKAMSALRKTLGLSLECALAIESWAVRYDAILREGQRLMGEDWKPADENIKLD